MDTLLLHPFSVLMINSLARDISPTSDEPNCNNNLSICILEFDIFAFIYIYICAHFMHTCIQHQQTLYTHLTQMSGYWQRKKVSIFLGTKKDFFFSFCKFCFSHKFRKKINCLIEMGFCFNWTNEKRIFLEFHSDPIKGHMETFFFLFFSHMTYDGLK